MTLYGSDSVTLAVEVPPALRGTPVLFVEASALRNPRGARVYVEVYLQGADGREHELGNFTFFGMTRETDKRAFAFPLEPVQRQALAISEAARVRTVRSPLTRAMATCQTYEWTSESGSKCGDDIIPIAHPLRRGAGDRAHGVVLVDHARLLEALPSVNRPSGH